MKLYRKKDECSVVKIMERHGFTDSTPDIGLGTDKIWTKDSEQYKFTGWENTPKTALMAENPKYINIERIDCPECGRMPGRDSRLPCTTCEP